MSKIIPIITLGLGIICFVLVVGLPFQASDCVHYNKCLGMKTLFFSFEEIMNNSLFLIIFVLIMIIACLSLIAYGACKLGGEI